MPTVLSNPRRFADSFTPTLAGGTSCGIRTPDHDLLEKIQVVPATTIHGQREVPPDLEGRLSVRDVGAAVHSWPVPSPHRSGERVRVRGSASPDARPLTLTVSPCAGRGDRNECEVGRVTASAMGGEEVNAFLTSLAVDGKVSASTQNQALSALLFLDKAVLDEPLPWLHDLVRAQRPQRLPVVLTVDEVRRVIDAVEEPSRLIVKLLYGSGLRLLEALTLRVKDVDFARGQVTVRDPKWKHDRVTMLPASVSAELSEQLVRAAALHQEDRVSCHA